MMTMKKMTALCITAAMTASLAACGSSSSTTTAASGEAASAAPASAASAAETSGGEKTKMTIALRGGSYAKVIESCLDAFEAENNVEIEALELEYEDLHSKIALDGANAEGTYDLVMVGGSWLSEYAENDVLLNLSEEGYEFDEDIIPSTTVGCKVDDAIYLAPYFGNVTVMLYNKELVEAAGYTGDDIDSWEDVEKIAAAVQQTGKNGYVTRGGSADSILTDVMPVMLANGAWIVDENNNPTVNTPEMKAAIEQYTALLETGMTMEKDDIVAQIDNGDGALAVGWPGWYSPTEDSNGSYTVIPTKLTDNGETLSTSVYGVWSIGIPANAPHKDLALSLLNYLMDPEVQLSTIDGGGVPCRYSCLENEDVLAKYPTMSVVCDALEVGVYRPIITQWNDFNEILGTEIDNYLQGVESLDDALANAQSQLEVLMAE
ncbi:MAG: extracellular solute-binding protein [Lachnospiraceae bacterium]|nr:extracellular solute-binding protein [Lachnospiraceae bacterium]